MKKAFILLSIFYLVVNFTFSQSLSPDVVKSISFQKPNDNIASNHFIGAIGESFKISFDILSGFEHDLYYQIEHCDFNWKKSQLLKLLPGFLIFCKSIFLRRRWPPRICQALLLLSSLPQALFCGENGYPGFDKPCCCYSACRRRFF